MAIKSAAAIKIDIAGLSPKVKLTPIQSILNDIVDSSGVGSNIYQCPLTSDLVAGDNTRTHSLYISVFNSRIGREFSATFGLNLTVSTGIFGL